MYYGEGAQGSFGRGKRSGQGSLQRTQQINDKMSLSVSCLIHCGPGCCSPLWGSGVKLALLQVGFGSPFVQSCHCWTADLQWDLTLLAKSDSLEGFLTVHRGGTEPSVCQRRCRQPDTEKLRKMVASLAWNCLSMLSLQFVLIGAQATGALSSSFSR